MQPLVEDTRVQALFVAEDAVGRRLGVVLEALGCECGRERGDEHRLVDVAELGADRAAPLTEMLGGLVEDAETATSPDAGPPRLEEVALESPHDVAGVDLLEARAHVRPARLNTATYWASAATTTSAWKSSWYPNVDGHRLGLCSAYTTAPAV